MKYYVNDKCCIGNGCVKKQRYSGMCMQHYRQFKAGKLYLSKTRDSESDIFIGLTKDELEVLFEALELSRRQNVSKLTQDSSEEELMQYERDRDRILPVERKLESKLEEFDKEYLQRIEERKKAINEIANQEIYPPIDSSDGLGMNKQAD